MTQHARTDALLRRLAKDRDALARFGHGSVALILSPAEVGEPQFQLMAAFGVNLLARLFPVVARFDDD